MKSIKEKLLTLWDSCEEGRTKAWDADPDGFEAMQQNIEEILKMLGFDEPVEYNGDIIDNDDDNDNDDDIDIND